MLKCYPLSSFFKSHVPKYRLFHSSVPRLNKIKPLKKGSNVYIPGYIKAKELSKILHVNIQEVVKFARKLNLKFKSHSDIILDYNASAELARNIGLTPVYKGILFSTF